MNRVGDFGFLLGIAGVPYLIAPDGRLQQGVPADLEAWLNRLVPENDPIYTHTLEGPDDMPAHIKAALTATSLAIPIMDGELALGTWQGIFLWEHRHHAGTRRVLMHVSP